MNQDGTRDLNWRQMPAWASRKPREIASAIAIGLTIGLVWEFAVTGGLGGGDGLGIVIAAMAAIGCWLVSMSAERGRGRPHVMGDIRLTKPIPPKNILLGLLLGLVGGLMEGIMAGFSDGLKVGLVFGLLAGLIGLGFCLMDVVANDPPSNIPLSLTTSRRRNRNYGLALGLMGGLVIALEGGLMATLHFRLASGPAIGAIMGLASGLIVGLDNAVGYRVSLASVQLAIEWRTPMRLMRFLDDACNRNVLRMVGPTYQFRHARLQDRLAAAMTTPTKEQGRQSLATGMLLH